MEQMSAEDAIAALNALTGDNPEGDHKKADEILLAVVPAEIGAAYRQLSGGHHNEDGRADWWAYA